MDRIEFYKWEVGAIEVELKQLRSEPMPNLKLTGKLKGLDRVKDLEQRQKGLIEWDGRIKKRPRVEGLYDYCINTNMFNV